MREDQRAAFLDAHDTLAADLVDNPEQRHRLRGQSDQTRKRADAVFRLT